jgi:hypothetical protein
MQTTTVPNPNRDRVIPTLVAENEALRCEIAALREALDEERAKPRYGCSFCLPDPEVERCWAQRRANPTAPCSCGECDEQPEAYGNPDGPTGPFEPRIPGISISSAAQRKRAQDELSRAIHMMESTLTVGEALNHKAQRS